jgi:hypothetical protein
MLFTVHPLTSRSYMTSNPSAKKLLIRGKNVKDHFNYVEIEGFGD